MQQDFIRAYKAAIRYDLTKEQFADYIGIKTKSVDRKRQKIKKELGLTLPLLKVTTDQDEDIPFDVYQKFTAELNLEQVFLKSIPIDKEKKRYVITSAQMSTPVNQPFLKSLENYCKVNDAQLIVIPYRYKNPTSLWNSTNKEEYISPPLVPYILTEHVEITPMLQILGDTKIVPTAIQPIHGIDSLTGNASGIIGHSKVQLTTIPTPSKDLPKIMASTGTVTIPNYTISKAGKRGEFHHSFSACVVEIEDNRRGFHLRHIYHDGEGFYDLDKYYKSNSVKKSKRIPVLVTGDYHAIFADTDVNKATFLDSTSIVKTLDPEMIVYHDVLDFYSRNHHHRGNDIIRYGKHHYGRDSVEEELQLTADLIDRFNDPRRKNIIIKSNHDEALDRWLSESDPKSDPENAQLYYYLKYNQTKNIVMTDTGFSSIDPFEFWCENPESKAGLKCFDNTDFLGRDDILSYKGILLNFHGDKGPNGSRGSVKNLAKIGSKIIIGHSHSPNIYEGAFQVGLSAKYNLEYAKGAPSSWLHTHCIVYPNGKRTLIHIVDGKWRL